MSNVIKLKRGSGSDPSASDLVVGELAIRTDTGKIFLKKDNGNVAEVSGGGGVADGDKGDITVSNSGDTFTIDNNAITTDKIANNAVSSSKLAQLAQNRILGRVDAGTGDVQFLTRSEAQTVLNVEDGATADQTASEILSLLSDQNISTTGTLGSSDITITGSQPALTFIDDGQNPDYRLYNNNGVLRLYDITNTTDRLVVNSDGHVDVTGNLDVGAGLDVTGGITYSATSIASGTLEFTDTLASYDPSVGTAGSDTSTNTAISLRFGQQISVNKQGYIRNLIKINSSADYNIEIGHTDTNYVGDISLHPGLNHAVRLRYNGGDRLVTESGGVDINGNLTGVKSIQTTGYAAITGTPNTYYYGRGDQATGVSVYAAEAALELVGTDTGNHAASLLIRTTADGAGFVYNPTTNALELKLFTPSADNFYIHDAGSNVSSLDTQLRVVKDAQVELAHNGSVKFETTSTGVDVTGNLEVDNFIRSTNGYGVGATTVISQSRELQNVTLNSSSVTATTQSAGNNTTRVATTAFVSTAIANLVDSSPSTLNTLNELAAALGDDANFSTTVTNSIATKLPLAGGTLTGDLEINTTAPILKFNESDTSKLYYLVLDGSALSIRKDSTAGSNIVQRWNSDGHVDFKFNVDCEAGLDVTGNIDITDGTLIIDTTPDSPNTSFGLQEALRIDDAGNTSDRGLNIYEYRQGGGRFFSLNYNLASSSTGSAYQYTQGNYAGSTMLRFDSTFKFFVDSSNDPNQNVITPTQRFLIDTSGVTVTGSIAVSGTVDGRDLAADGSKLDTYAANGSSYVRSDADDTLNGQYIINDSADEKLVLQGSTNPYIRFKEGTTNKAWLQWHGTGGYVVLGNSEDNTGIRIDDQLRVTRDGFTTMHQVWDAGNDGSGSGLDADTLDGVQGANYVRTDQNTTITSDLFVGGGAGALTVNAGSDIRFTNGDWTGNTSDPKINAHAGYLYIVGGSNGIIFRESATNRWQIEGSGHFRPETDSTYDIGTSSIRVRNGYFDTLYGDGSNITGVNATTLDSIDSGSFLRSDANDTFTGTLTAGQNGKIAFPDNTNIPDNPTNQQHDYITFGANGSISQITGRVGLMITSSDDSLVLANGDIGREFTSSNINVDPEDIFLLSDGNFVVKTDLQEGWGTEHTLDFTNAGLLRVNTNTVFHAGNDGSGSGLDADKLDGVEASSFLRSDANDTATGDIEFTGHVRIVTGDIDNTNTTKGLMFDAGYENGQYRTRIRKDDKGGGIPLYIDSSEGTANSYTAIARFGSYSGNAEKFEVFGTAKATTFSGSGASLTNIPAGQLTGTIADARIPNTITPATLVSTAEVRTSTGQQLVLNAGESNGKVSGQTGEYVYVNAEQGLSVNTPDSANANWQGGTASDQTLITGTAITIDGNTVFHQGNDGSGSGLDADKLDGQQGSHYLDYNNFSNTPTIPTNNNQLTNGAGFLTSVGTSNIANNAVDFTKIQDISHSRIIGRAVGSAGGNPDQLTATQVRAIINVEDGATADQTASEILTLLKTVDGSGSGLDADTLDGQQQSYYWNQGSTGLQSDNRISTLSNFNNSVPSGFYQSSTASNMPGTSWHNMLNVRHSNTANDHGFQLSMSYYNEHLYSRTYKGGSGNNDGTFTTWAKQFSDRNDGSGSGLDADTLDGVQGSSYLRSDAADTGTTLTLTDALRTDRFEDQGGAFFWREGLTSGRHRHLNLADTTSDPASVNDSSNPTGISWGQRSDNNAYYMLGLKGAYNNGYSNHSRLTLGWHTGIELGASATYGGVRFFGDTPFLNTTEIMQVNSSGGHVKVKNNLYANNGGLVWNQNNDGSGSGLDADTLDGTQANSLIRGGAQSSVSGWHISGYRNGSGTSPRLYFSHSSGYGQHINTYNTSDGVYNLELHNNSKQLFVVYNSGRTIHGGNVLPGANNSYDLGSSGARWNNLYVNDMHFSNEGSQNSVDGSWGDWTLQEGENDIFMINNRSGKKFKIAMIPV